MDDCSCYLNESEQTSLLENKVKFKESDPSLNITLYISCEVLTSPENSAHSLLTVFNELEGDQKECSMGES